MKKGILILVLVILSVFSFSQLKEGQSFCDESVDGGYFPLSFREKVILWANTYYLETITGTKKINGKTYIEFKQAWENKNISMLYLREENGVIYQYEECCEDETIRYDIDFKEGKAWQTADGKGAYHIVSYKGKLKTPYCEYENLMVIEAKLAYGNYKFYYLKGYGYIGATKNDKIISCLAPEIPKRFKNK